jgi:hypothetical protein
VLIAVSDLFGVGGRQRLAKPKFPLVRRELWGWPGLL